MKYHLLSGSIHKLHCSLQADLPCGQQLPAPSVHATRTAAAARQQQHSLMKAQQRGAVAHRDVGDASSAQGGIEERLVGGVQRAVGWGGQGEVCLRASCPCSTVSRDASPQLGLTCTRSATPPPTWCSHPSAPARAALAARVQRPAAAALQGSTLRPSLLRRPCWPPPGPPGVPGPPEVKRQQAQEV